MRTCVFPGSFDPVTIGHMDLIRRASVLFDQVTVTVMVNIRKQGALTPDQRMDFLRKACEHLPNVRVDRWDGLLADYMREKGETCLIRGIRNGTELDAEMDAARINHLLNSGIETLFLPASDGLAMISSSMVRELAAFGADISPYVPEETEQEIIRLLSKHTERKP